MTKAITFRQADIERAARALKAVGESIGGVHVRADGSFSVLTKDEASNEDALSPLEAWEREHGHRAA